MPRTSSWSCASGGSRRTSRRTPVADARRSTAARPATPVTRTSQRARKRIEEAFGWLKTTAGQARTRLRGVERVRWTFTLAAAAYNLIRLPKLIEASP